MFCSPELLLSANTPEELVACTAVHDLEVVDREGYSSVGIVRNSEIGDDIDNFDEDSDCISGDTDNDQDFDYNNYNCHDCEHDFDSGRDSDYNQDHDLDHNVTM